MDQKSFAEALLRLATEQGVQAEIYARSGESTEVSAAGGEIERYNVSQSGGVSLRVNAGGHCGYAYSECCEDAETLLSRALDNARVIEEDGEHPMQHARAYAEIERREPALAAMPHSEKIELALALEKETLSMDPRVKRVVYCDVGTGKGRTLIQNSDGLHAARDTAQAYCYVMPVVEDGGETQTGFAFRMNEEAMDITGCAREAVDAALEKLKAAPVPSGMYRVLIQNLAMADLLEAFAPMFSADEAQKGRSLLGGREGQIIGAPCVTITDDPFHSIAPRAFDDEGTPMQRKCVVEKGRLMTLLHNLKTARKADTETTGNARRASAASPIGTAPSVFYIEPGSEGFDALVKRLDRGLIVTSLSGLHAGLSTVSGDFSLEASGKLVENGKIVRAVNGVTLAGNFLTLLNSVEAVANDLRFVMPGAFYTASPSLLVYALSVAGN